MARITVQMGHCFRTSGATGTRREQEFAGKVGPQLRDALRARGHTVRLIGADDPVPSGDVFIALHTDGSTNPGRRGASVGYPDSGGQQLARAWKRRHHEQGYPGGWLADNYTAALRGYYGFGRAARAGGYEHRFLAEHGTTTNRDDERWLFANLGRCVQAHVDAIGDVVGHPTAPSPAPAPAPPAPRPSQEDDMLYLFWHKGGVYAAVGGVRSAHGLPREVIDYWRGQGVKVHGDGNPPSDIPGLAFMHLPAGNPLPR